MLLACICAPLHAADAAAERARISRERSAVEVRAKAAEAACAGEFAVSACLRQARAERRAALRQLDSQQAVLDDAQRKQRAAQRMARIRERQDAAARAEPKPRIDVKARSARAAPPEPGASQVQDAQAGRAERAAAAASAADAQAAQRAEAAARRAQKAQAHREEVEARNRERAAKKAPSPPLPIPSAPASAAR